jgi:cytochrome c
MCWQQSINQPDGKFSSVEYSVFVIDFQGVTQANSTFPEFVGKNFIALKDPDGVEFVKEYVNVAQNKGSGWCEYKFLLPDKVSTAVKLAYISKLPVKINGVDAWISR